MRLDQGGGEGERLDGGEVAEFLLLIHSQWPAPPHTASPWGCWYHLRWAGSGLAGHVLQHRPGGCSFPALSLVLAASRHQTAALAPPAPLLPHCWEQHWSGPGSASLHPSSVSGAALGSASQHVEGEMVFRGGSVMSSAASSKMVLARRGEATPFLGANITPAARLSPVVNRLHLVSGFARTRTPI